MDVGGNKTSFWTDFKDLAVNVGCNLRTTEGDTSLLADIIFNIYGIGGGRWDLVTWIENVRENGGRCPAEPDRAGRL